MCCLVSKLISSFFWARKNEFKSYFFPSSVKGQMFAPGWGGRGKIQTRQNNRFIAKICKKRGYFKIVETY